MEETAAAVVPEKPKKIKLSREFRALEMEFGGCFGIDIDDI